MSYDLQFLRDRAPASVAMIREHAIYIDAQRSDRRVQKTRNIADVLERGNRPSSERKTALLVDLKA
jgi:hypothetical protein